MDYIIEIVIKVIVMSITVLITIFFPDYIGRVLTGEWKIEIADKWYEFLNYGMAELAIATILFSVMLMILCKSLYIYVDSRKKFVISIGLSMVIIYIGNKLFWMYLQEKCFGKDEVWNIGINYVEKYHSISQAQKFIFLITITFFIIGALLAKPYIFFNTLLKKEIVREIIPEREQIEIYIYEAIPIYILMAGVDFFVYHAGKVISQLYLLFMFMQVLRIAYLERKNYKKLLKYCLEVKKYKRENYEWITVNEDPKRNKSFFFNKVFLNKEYRIFLEKKKIVILPKKIYCQLFEDTNYISIYVYGESLLLKNTTKMQAYVNGMKSDQGEYHIAYCEYGGFMDDIEKDSCLVFDDFDRLLNQILQLKKYKSEKNQILSRLNIKTDINNCIINELVEFKKQLSIDMDLFSMFDSLLKYLEGLNYFYTLVLVSILNLDIKCMKEEIKNAGFGKWKAIRSKILKGVNEKDTNIAKFRGFLDGKVSEDIVEKYNEILLEVSNKEGEKRICSIDTLFEKLVRIRNYTRGHGVYTFEITTNLNLLLLEIMVYLTNYIIKSNFLEMNFENLRTNSWIISDEVRVYFMYSLNGSNFIYQSFAGDITLAIPDDFIDEV